MTSELLLNAWKLFQKSLVIVKWLAIMRLVLPIPRTGLLSIAFIKYASSAHNIVVKEVTYISFFRLVTLPLVPDDSHYSPRELPSVLTLQ